MRTICARITWWYASRRCFLFSCCRQIFYSNARENAALNRSSQTANKRRANNANRIKAGEGKKMRTSRIRNNCSAKNVANVAIAAFRLCGISRLSVWTTTEQQQFSPDPRWYQPKRWCASYCWFCKASFCRPVLWAVRLQSGYGASSLNCSFCLFNFKDDKLS